MCWSAFLGPNQALSRNKRLTWASWSSYLSDEYLVSLSGLILSVRGWALVMPTRLLTLWEALYEAKYLGLSWHCETQIPQLNNWDLTRSLEDKALQTLSWRSEDLGPIHLWVWGLTHLRGLKDLNSICLTTEPEPLHHCSFLFPACYSSWNKLGCQENIFSCFSFPLEETLKLKRAILWHSGQSYTLAFGKQN